MGKRSGWQAVLLTAMVLALVPMQVWGQDSIGRPDPVWPLPLGHDHMDAVGGFYAAGEFLYWRQTNPIKSQLIAVRGFVDSDGSVQAARELLNGNTTDTIIPGKFFGSGQEALNSNQVSGQNSYVPGIGVTLGWRFGDDTAVEFRWRHLQSNRLSAVAALLGPNQNFGVNQSDSYLYSPVFNFPNDFAGPTSKIGVSGRFGALNNGSNANATIVFPQLLFGGNGQILFSGQTVLQANASSNGSIVVPQAAFGIWNGASIMTISFTQRYDEFDLIGRVPIYQDENFRCYGLVGPRNVHIWENFQWRTLDVDLQVPNGAASATASFNGSNGTQTTTGNNVVVVNNNATPSFGSTATATVGATNSVAGGNQDPMWTAKYSNIVSNEMYGPMIGTGSECYLGGGFSVNLDLRAAILIDFVKERAKYERQDKLVSVGRKRTDYTIVPELDANVAIRWYPIEGVEFKLGYDLLNFFNTVSSPKPVDFNYGGLSPQWYNNQYRMIDGWNASVALIF